MRSHSKNKAFRILLISLISVLSVSSAMASGRAGRLQLQPFVGPASTEAHLWSGDQVFAVLYGAQIDYFVDDNISIGVSYTYVDYGNHRSVVGYFAGIPIFGIFSGPVAQMVQFRLKIIPFDVGPIAPYLRGSTGYLQIDQEDFHYRSALSEADIGTAMGAIDYIIPTSGRGNSFSLGAGGVMELAPGWGAFFEVSRIWSDVDNGSGLHRDGYGEEFWTLKSGLSLWY